MTQVIVIGAGIAGLSAALAMQAKGFDVRLLERDPPPPDVFDPTTVSPWRRRGAPQVPHPHFLMGGLRNLIYTHHPNLVHDLLRAGVWELPFSETLHPVAKSNYVEEPGRRAAHRVRQSPFHARNRHPALRRGIAARRGDFEL